MTLSRAELPGAGVNGVTDAKFFGGIRLGMTIDAVVARYKSIAKGGILFHSGTPPGQKQLDFRTDTEPQRRVYVFFRTSDRKIVSVLYWKLGDGETFSEREATELVALNKSRIPGKSLVKLNGAELIITTQAQYELQMQY